MFETGLFYDAVSVSLLIVAIAEFDFSHRKIQFQQWLNYISHRWIRF